jgi:hypothetical protein
MLHRAVLLLLVLSIARAAEASQAPPPLAPRIADAVRLDATDQIRVDGVLDEPVWQRASAAGDFLQRDPDNGAPATERTEVRVVYDADRLVLGVTLHDSEPGRLLGHQLQRDQSFDADDSFMWTIDTFLDGRSGYYFEINPAGAMGDGLIDPSDDGGFSGLGAGVNRSWDGIWTARVRQTGTGWSAEIEIPFGTLNFDQGAAAWGINFQRTIRRKNEANLWSGHLRNHGLARMSNAGQLSGLRELSQGVGLDLKPYAAGYLSSAPGRGLPSAVSDGDVGLDAFYSVTPALRGNISINTDFAETEVDQRQVNLTRFPLFFEEKRDFFLQGSSYFDFARDPGQAVMPFFSRRIGLTEGGVPQRINMGAKLTGQAGQFDVGALHVRTGDDARAPGESFSVARVRRRLFTQSFAGGIYTRRAGGAPGMPDRQTLGVDTALRTSTFRGHQTVDVSGFFLWTSNPAGSGDSSAYGLHAQFPNDPFRANFAFRELQPNYQPAVGFLQRTGYRRFNPDVGYYWRPGNHRWFREFDFQLDIATLTDMQNRTLSHEFGVVPFDVNFHDGGRFAFEIKRHYERLDEDFEISDGVVLPVGGEYWFNRYEIGAQTAGHRKVSVGADVALGDFFSGQRQDYAVELSVRPRRGLSLATSVERNVLDLSEGSFTTDVVRLVGNTQFSPWMSLANTIQYDSVSRSMGWQARFRWIQRPGNDLFLVYTHNWQEPLSTSRSRRFETLDNRLATKLVYTLRF